MGAHGWNINKSFFGMAFAGCVLVLVRHLVSSFGGCGVCGTLLGRGWWVVFGALLGPEATGPFCSNAEGHFWCFFCSCSRHFRSLFTVPFLCVGVVVVGVWLTGLLFENYIVDASI